MPTPQEYKKAEEALKNLCKWLKGQDVKEISVGIVPINYKRYINSYMTALSMYPTLSENWKESYKVLHNLRQNVKNILIYEKEKEKQSIKSF